MKNVVIIRHDIVVAQKQSLEVVIALEKKVIQNMLNQSDEDFKCFIEYPKAMEEQIKELTMEAKDTHFIQWIREEGNRIRGNCWKKRLVCDVIKDYVDALDLNEEDCIMFVSLPMNMLYSTNLVAYLKAYEPKTNEKVLKFKQVVEYINGEKTIRQEELSQAFVYRCTWREFKAYFYQYQLLMGFAYGNFVNCPMSFVEEVNLLKLNGSEPTLIKDFLIKEGN